MRSAWSPLRSMSFETFFGVLPNSLLALRRLVGQERLSRRSSGQHRTRLATARGVTLGPAPDLPSKVTETAEPPSGSFSTGPVAPAIRPRRYWTSSLHRPICCPVELTLSTALPTRVAALPTAVRRGTGTPSTLFVLRGLTFEPSAMTPPTVASVAAPTSAGVFALVAAAATA
jgi:hypothetical protein